MDIVTALIAQALGGSTTPPIPPAPGGIEEIDAKGKDLFEVLEETDPGIYTLLIDSTTTNSPFTGHPGLDNFKATLGVSVGHYDYKSALFLLDAALYYSFRDPTERHFSNWDEIILGSLSNIDTKADKPKVEAHTIASNSWNDLSDKEPFKFKTSFYPNYFVGATTLVELFNDNAILFSQYGFAIGEIDDTEGLITIYAIKKPTESVTLRLGFSEVVFNAAD